MARIVMIGAGSAGFCRNLIQDCLTYESLQDAHFALMDIDGERGSELRVRIGHYDKD